MEYYKNTAFYFINFIKEKEQINLKEFKFENYDSNGGCLSESDGN